MNRGNSDGELAGGEPVDVWERLTRYEIQLVFPLAGHDARRCAAAGRVRRREHRRAVTCFGPWFDAGFDAGFGPRFGPGPDGTDRAD